MDLSWKRGDGDGEDNLGDPGSKQGLGWPFSNILSKAEKVVIWRQLEYISQKAVREEEGVKAF